MTKSRHCEKRSVERGIDEISLCILSLYGEHLDSRDGLSLSKESAQSLKGLALAFKSGQSISSVKFT